MATPAPRTINDLADRFNEHALTYYCRSDGTLSGEHVQMDAALRHLRIVGGSLVVKRLTAELLDAARQHMLDGNLKRKTINSRVHRIIRAARWWACPPRRWISTTQVEDLRLLPMLRAGRCGAQESEPVRPVEDEVVAATLRHANATIRMMVELQRGCGMRPGEVCEISRSQLKDGPEGTMIYEPRRHKTSHHGKARVIVIGPATAAKVRAWMANLPADRDKLFGYSRSTYSCKIARLCKLHDIPHWHPHQLRHAFATQLVRQVGREGLDIARNLLGHSSIAMTERYSQFAGMERSMAFLINSKF